MKMEALVEFKRSLGRWAQQMNHRWHFYLYVYRRISQAYLDQEEKAEKKDVIMSHGGSELDFFSLLVARRGFF